MLKAPLFVVPVDFSPEMETTVSAALRSLSSGELSSLNRCSGPSKAMSAAARRSIQESSDPSGTRNGVAMILSGTLVAARGYARRRQPRKERHDGSG